MIKKALVSGTPGFGLDLFWVIFCSVHLCTLVKHHQTTISDIFCFTFFQASNKQIQVAIASSYQHHPPTPVVTELFPPTIEVNHGELQAAEHRRILPVGKPVTSRARTTKNIFTNSVMFVWFFSKVTYFWWIPSRSRFGISKPPCLFLFGVGFPVVLFSPCVGDDDPTIIFFFQLGLGNPLDLASVFNVFSPCMPIHSKEASS